MEKGVRIADLFRNEDEYIGKTTLVQGWVRTKRDSKAGIGFIELNDGSSLKNLQVIAEQEHPDYGELLKRITTGSAILAEGTLSVSPGKGQSVELRAERIRLYGWADPALYPLQKKRHSFEYLRQIAHLRPRTNTIGAAARVRNRLSYAIHQFFQDLGFYYIHTPIITASDCEGAGEIFRVTTLDPAHPIFGAEDPYQSDFFAKPAFLTVSGQLQAEIYALALGRVYSFGPTFRAENSNTSRHLAEFWMVEPEMAFFDLDDDLDLAQAFIKKLVSAALNDCREDLEFFTRFIDPELTGRLQTAAESAFEVISYTEAVDILLKSTEQFSFPIEWGHDLQAEHERYLTERVFHKPVGIINFPRSLKPFYMRVNDDEKTVAAMDILVPGTGEIIGGSQREERPEVLLEQMRLKGVSAEDYQWYIELRQFGSVPHSGFGLGLERMMQFITGIPNIREVIPFPRTPGHAEF
ncbi:MAG TPA: asparagine--tRNA ligase [Syntrophobacteraceae bacterium]|nr:asparagine--tRNA ligase [Syntrophobacteraceae bacterium]